jgi:MFS family permease
VRSAEAAPGVETTGAGRRLEGVRTLFGTPDFRRYWAASAAFGLGIWAYLTAMGWTALELTDSAFAVSMVNVVYFLPLFVLALPAGVLADRRDRRRIPIVTRGLSGVSMIAMVGMAVADRLSYAWLLVFSAGVGLSVIAELSARQAFVAQIVSPRQLVNATALTAVQGGVSRVLGPLLAGWLLSVGGDAGGYAVYGASCALFVWFFWRIRTPGAVPGRGRGSKPMHDLVEGLAYLRGHRDALTVVGISVLSGVVGWVYLALMPVMARDVLDGGAVTLGALSMAVGIGSVPGSLALSVVRDFTAEGRTFAIAVVVWGAGIIVFGASPWLPLSLVALAAAGLGFGIQVVLTRTILLRIVDGTYHGRVMGTLMLTWGANVIGTFGAGAAAEALGAPVVVAVSGALIVGVLVVAVALNRSVLRV